MGHRLTPLLLATSLLCAACGEDAGDAEPGLRGFQSCGELERYLENRATQAMNARIDAILKSLGNEVTPRAFDASAPAATSYTTTNTQERGVDEPDFVKNDGQRIFLLHGRRLVILKAWPPRELSLQASVPVEGDPLSMFLNGNQLVVFSSLGGYVPFDAALTRPPRSYEPRTKATVFDVSGAAPLPLHELYLSEGYQGARRTGRHVRLITTTDSLGPELSYYPEEPVDWTDVAALRAAFERLRAENARRIKATTLEEWLPAVDERRQGAALAAVTRQCSAFHASNTRTDLGLTTVSTLDLARLDQPATFTSMLSPASEVYSSAESLYLTARAESSYFLWRTQPAGERARTFLHKFSYDSGRVRYVASGSVYGHVADQFSLDEQDGYLRVATTEGNTWDTAHPPSNGVFLLRAAQGRLVQAGQLTGLAPGEVLYAARFLGARGYLVTFRQIDPLFTLDLAQPTAPRVAGELKVPGFSTYLHPLDAAHLLTIGRDVSDDGRTQNGVQLQVFDVSELARPALLHRLSLGAPNGYSEAGYDHKAFNFFQSRGLLAIPYSNYTRASGTFRSSIEIFRVSLARGIEPVGSVDHAELSGVEGYPGWTPYMRRSVMMDDYVYSISWSGVKVNDTRALDRELASVRLPAPWSE